ncbi:hypothetical protein PAI11_39340 [Patulibacter medicamentivorans]|uniref:Uncharacterized protein n=1 Tax=Patulibacter medicamentivorans TaxID=1097667 RepID=H0EAR0_9ACTN|nr:hypothetical protein PAI11_39340 [Patulibacter medicamentivorans]
MASSAPRAAGSGGRSPAASAPTATFAEVACYDPADPREPRRSPD